MANTRHIIIIIIIIMFIILLSLVTRHFSPALLLNQRRSPPLNPQVSHCSTLCYVWCSKCSCLLYWICWMLSCCGFKCFFRPFVTMPVAPAVTGMITHYMFHIRCVTLYTYVNSCLLLLLLLLFTYFLLYQNNYCGSTAGPNFILSPRSQN